MKYQLYVDGAKTGRPVEVKFGRGGGIEIIDGSGVSFYTSYEINSENEGATINILVYSVNRRNNAFPLSNPAHTIGPKEFK